MQKLELTWIGKGQEPAVEPRILLHDASHDYGDPNATNMLIHGDNLLALKALEQEFSGRVKCIYIDPPYNTGEAFAEYDDNLEHSIWLKLMYSRLALLRQLLADDGVIFVQLNDEEMNYCKVMMDEIFGRSNFINLVALKTKNTAGASGGGEDKRLKKNVEFILIYAKSYDLFHPFQNVYSEEDLFELIEDMQSQGKSWKYTSILLDVGEQVDERIVLDGSGDEILVQKFKGVKRTTTNRLVRDGMSEQEAYATYFDQIFSDTNAQTSIRTRIIDEFKQLADDEALIASYIPKTGRDKGKRVYHHYISPTIRRVIWLKDTAEKATDGRIIKKEKLGTYWEGFNWNNVNKEGGVVFTGGKKPEALIQRIIEMASDSGDIVLDSFLGSGTTAATAHKLGRQYIGVELGDHCYTHCLPRLKSVVDGDQTGISPTIGWQGGGGFKFYELAPTLIIKDENGFEIISDQYDATMLAAAVAKLCGYRFAPREGNPYIHGVNNVGGFIFVTTQYITAPLLGEIAKHFSDMQSLVICASAFQVGIKNNFPNIKLRKIPQSVLSKCEYGAENYNLNVVELPDFEETEEDFEDAE
ncbi:MAG: site-specific DNA-methyltransferase [Clostridia bacterium]|nr:site-specific DNA-methyltransferase [Clostridia bacterium]